MDFRPYAVTHAGGTGTVTVNQRVNGGQRNLLGTYSFDSGTTYKVELSDAVSAGKVAADAISIAPAGAPSGATHFHYDRDGKLIAESDAAGGTIQEYVWLDGLPIAEFTAGSAGTPPDSAQVDNSDGGASFTGDWTTATDGSGYIGSNYRKYDPLVGGAPPDGTVIDNSSAEFRTIGVWQPLTTPSGFEGSDYRARDRAGDGDGSEVIIDNTDAGFSTTGTWGTSTGVSGYWAATMPEPTPTNCLRRRSSSTTSTPAMPTSAPGSRATPPAAAASTAPTIACTHPTNPAPSQ